MGNKTKHPKNENSLKDSKKAKNKFSGQASLPDTALKQYFSDPEIFSELLSGCMGFEKPIEPTQLREENTNLSEVFLVANELKGVQLYPDVAMSVVDEHASYTVAMYILQLQTNPDPTMPMRVRLTTDLILSRQLKEIITRNLHALKKIQEERSTQDKQAQPPTASEGETSWGTNPKVKDLFPTKGEFLARFRYTDKLNPVIPLVFYVGKEAWTKNRSLQDMMYDGAPEQLIPTSPFLLIDLVHMNEADLTKYPADLQKVFRAVQNYYAVDEDRILHSTQISDVFKGLSDRDLVAVFAMLGRADFSEIVTDIRQRRGSNMSIFDEVIQKVIQTEYGDELKAKDEANKQTTAFAVIETCRLNGISEDTILSTIQKVCGLNQEKAQDYMRLYGI
ncbi:MAG: Rpn family recombination-promoting nuclease/putative transposase [Clostridia bacterium]|nr:Rpn family recombination-promoting nuclease/putative transposase [Clostridia bacterium]